MYARRLVVLIFILGAFGLVVNGCGGSYSSMQTAPGVSPQNAAVTMTIRDTPPAGVTVLALELTVNGALLNPGNYQLVSKPVKIEVKNLETDAAFLSTVGVPPGTYQSIAVNLTNPELTILNQSGSAIGSCANNSVCELEPAAAGNIMFSGPPFPITIQSGAPVGFQVDVNVASLINSSLGVDFNATGAVSIAQLPLPGRPADHLDDLDDLMGVVLNLDATAKTFSLHTADGDFPIQASSNTQFEFENCAADNFTCLQNNMVVKVDIDVMPGGAMTATKIEFEDDAIDDELVGAIFKIDDATHFEMVVLGELRSVNNVALGNPVVVTLSNPSFEVKADGLNVPSSLLGAFTSAVDTSDLIAGEVVEVRPTAPINAGPPITVTADRVRLRMTQLSGSVSGSPAPPDFTLGNLPGLFTSAGITSIDVQTSSVTDFEGVSGLTGLADQNTVSVRGLLFKNGANPPVLVADKVRKR
jgi:predicted component of type VI protein secretion system